MLLRFDVDGDELVRAPPAQGGFAPCIVCGVGEPGELLVKVATTMPRLSPGLAPNASFNHIAGDERSNSLGLLAVKVTPGSVFLGYTSKEATAKKLVDNVLEPGDQYARVRSDASVSHSPPLFLLRLSSLRRLPDRRSAQAR